MVNSKLVKTKFVFKTSMGGAFRQSHSRFKAETTQRSLHRISLPGQHHQAQGSGVDFRSRKDERVLRQHYLSLLVRGSAGGD